MDRPRAKKSITSLKQQMHGVKHRPGQKCVTLHPDFQDNMLLESVLKIDVCRYLEEN